MKYCQEVIFEKIDNELSENLIALLSDIGFESFEEMPDLLKAYIDKESLDIVRLDQIANRFSCTYTMNSIEEQNWNAVWEANFEPVEIDDFVTVRAHFHAPNPNSEFDILITPKMSFGTGHHATTYLMVQQMRSLDFSSKKVLDFGTGTGVLAILANFMGAKYIKAIDNDSWSIENAKENIKNNHCENVHVSLADSAMEQGTFDIIVANINKNVLLNNSIALSDSVASGGYLLISGLLLSDEKDILADYLLRGLSYVHTKQKNGWIAILFRKG